MKAIGAVLGLAKAQISIMVTVTTATGYLLFKEGWDPELLIVTGGIFLAACGSAALNQVQEARIDARMERTRGRPIP